MEEREHFQGERDRKVSNKVRKRNGLGERERKVSNKEGAKEMDWEKGKREEGKQKGRSKGYGLEERDRKE